jgi:hypothetical protein
MFEICCIPFFVYGLALGDWVETQPHNGKRFVVRNVVKRSSTLTYRVVFVEKSNWYGLVDEWKTLGCQVEPRWNESMLVGVNVPQHLKQEFEALLQPRVATGELKYELAN